MRQMLGTKLIVVLSVMCGLACSLKIASAAGGGIQDAKLEVEKVALFKNGLGYITSTATLPQDASTIRFGQLAVPTFGTFWVGYAKNLKVRALVASMEDVEESIPAQNVGQLLLTNVGRKVILRTGTGENDVVEGVILAESAETIFPEPVGPYFMDTRRQQDGHGRSVVDVAPTNVVQIKTDKGIVALNIHSITRADFESDDAICPASVKQKRPGIRMELDQPAGREKVSISYLARGVTWAPGYLIDLSDEKIARFSAHALVINELMDFEKVDLELITGFPNIRFSEVPNPIAMSQNLADFLKTLNTGRTDGRRDFTLGQQAIVMNQAEYYHDFEAPLMPGYSTAAQGMVSEDLFLYPVKEFSLKKGETAWLPLFTAEMPYKHIYTWKIADFVDNDDRYRNERDRAESKPAEEVWHSCRLMNNLKMPLTTAAAEFVKDGAFTGQDICYYTAPGAETTIRINRAMNVLGEQAEGEVKRSRNAGRFYGYDHDLVTVQGELKLRSRLDQPVKVEIIKELSGEVLEISPDAKDEKTARGLRQVNPKHLLTWEIELKPGEERKLSYKYQVYIRG